VTFCSEKSAERFGVPVWMVSSPRVTPIARPTTEAARPKKRSSL
jgi:hypothetical protein